MKGATTLWMDDDDMPHVRIHAESGTVHVEAQRTPYSPTILWQNARQALAWLDACRAQVIAAEMTAADHVGEGGIPMADRSTWRPLDGSPGFYVDDRDVLHVDEDEAIRATGHLPTPASRKALRAAVLDLGRQGVTVDVVDDDDVPVRDAHGRPNTAGGSRHG